MLKQRLRFDSGNSSDVVMFDIKDAVLCQEPMLFAMLLQEVSFVLRTLAQCSGTLPFNGAMCEGGTRSRPCNMERCTCGEVCSCRTT